MAGSLPGPRVSESELELEDDRTVSHQGKPFTGVAVESGPGGALRSEVSYLEGRRHGPSRTYFPSGRLQSELGYERGAQQGQGREYDETGALRVELSFERGVVVSRVRWGADGREEERYTLPSDHPSRRLLEALEGHKPR